MYMLCFILHILLGVFCYYPQCLLTKCSYFTESHPIVGLCVYGWHWKCRAVSNTPGFVCNFVGWVLRCLSSYHVQCYTISLLLSADEWLHYLLCYLMVSNTLNDTHGKWNKFLQCMRSTLSMSFWFVVLCHIAPGWKNFTDKHSTISCIHDYILHNSSVVTKIENAQVMLALD